MENVIDLSPVLFFVIQVLAAVALGLGIWAIKKFSTKLGIEADSVMNDLFENALQRGISYAAERAREIAGNAQVTVDNRLLAEIAGYVQESIPGILKQFNITEERLTKMILARLTERPDIVTEHDASSVAVVGLVND